MDRLIESNESTEKTQNNIWRDGLTARESGSWFQKQGEVKHIERNDQLFVTMYIYRCKAQNLKRNEQRILKRIIVQHLTISTLPYS